MVVQQEQTMSSGQPKGCGTTIRGSESIETELWENNRTTFDWLWLTWAWTMWNSLSIDCLCGFFFTENLMFPLANCCLFVFMPPPFEEWWRGIKCYPCPCVRPSVCPSVRPLSKFGVRSITFERLHRFNSNLVCWYIISKHRSSSIWVTIH